MYLNQNDINRRFAESAQRITGEVFRETDQRYASTSVSGGGASVDGYGGAAVSSKEVGIPTTPRPMCEVTRRARP